MRFSLYFSLLLRIPKAQTGSMRSLVRQPAGAVSGLRFLTGEICRYFRDLSRSNAVSLAGNCDIFEATSEKSSPQVLLAIFQFPFSDASDQFACNGDQFVGERDRSAVCNADLGHKSIGSKLLDRFGKKAGTRKAPTWIVSADCGA